MTLAEGQLGQTCEQSRLERVLGGCGPFGNKAIWEQSHLGTIGGPFGYSELGPLGTIYWAFWVQLTELSRCYRIFELPVQGWRRVIYRSPEMCV